MTDPIAPMTLSALTSPVTPPQPKRHRWWLYLTIAAVALALAAGGTTAFMLLREDKPPAPAVEDKNSAAALVQTCHTAVLGRLKAPGTAQFGGEFTRTVGTQVSELTGWVDAQNGFGALIRMRWVCTATATSVGWSVTDVKLSDW